MDKDGLYLLSGPDGRVLCLIVENNRSTVSMRYFATKEDAISILEDDVLSEHERTAVLSHLTKGGFYTDSYQESEYVAFMRYELKCTN
jgi:hypothetical protein